MREREVARFVKFYTQEVYAIDANKALEEMQYWIDQTSESHTLKIMDTASGLASHYLNFLLPHLDWKYDYAGGESCAEKVSYVAMSCNFNPVMLQNLIKNWHRKLGPEISAYVGDFYMFCINSPQIWGTVQYEKDEEYSEVKLHPIKNIPCEKGHASISLSGIQIEQLNVKRSNRGIYNLEDQYGLHDLQMWCEPKLNVPKWSVGRSVLHLERMRASLRKLPT